MELTPQLLTDEIDFRIAVRGYDRNEVDDFLERVAVAVGQLQSQLAKAVARAKAAEKRFAEVADGGSPLPVRETETKATPEPEAKPEPEVAPPPRRRRRSSAPMRTSTRSCVVRSCWRSAPQTRRSGRPRSRPRGSSRRRVSKPRSSATRPDAASSTRSPSSRRCGSRCGVTPSCSSATSVTSGRGSVETIQVLRRLVDDPQSLQASPLPELSAAATPELSGTRPRTCGRG